MSSNNTRSPAGSAAVITAALLVVYILSPALIPIVIRFSGYPPDFVLHFLGVFYAPLQFAAENIPAIENFYEWYFGLLGVM